jgi:hypothetical protein
LYLRFKGEPFGLNVLRPANQLAPKKLPFGPLVFVCLPAYFRAGALIEQQADRLAVLAFRHICFLPIAGCMYKILARVTYFIDHGLDIPLEKAKKKLL